MADEKRILRSLEDASKRLAPEETKDFWQMLQKLSEMDQASLSEFLKSFTDEASGKCILGAALVISCYDDAAEDDSLSDQEEQERCRDEVELVSKAFEDATGKEAIKKDQPTRDEFYELVEQFVREMEAAFDKGIKDFLFYYAGHGCQLQDGNFRFLPAHHQRSEDYIPLPDIINKIEGSSILKDCTVILAIDACRDNPEKETSAHIHHTVPEKKNTYPKFFSTQPGESAEHDLFYKVSPFAEKMAESIPQMKNRWKIYSVLNQAGKKIHGGFCNSLFQLRLGFKPIRNKQVQVFLWSEALRSSIRQGSIEWFFSKHPFLGPPLIQLRDYLSIQLVEI